MLEESLMLLGLGFVLGLGHAFDPDHIIAISSLVSKHKNLKRSTILGAFWGLGHTTTLFMMGLLVLGLQLTIPEKVSLSVEFLVGMVIVVLGASVLKDVWMKKKHIHRHTHDGVTHVHFHSHKETRTHDHAHVSFVVGLIHGMAGSAALMLLVLSTVKSFGLGMLYILLFGAGSIVGMAFASTLISLPFIVTARKFSSWDSRIRSMSGIFSISFGIFLMLRILF